MDNLTPNSLEQVLVERLSIIRDIQSAFKRREESLPKRFRRGIIQRELCQEVSIPFIGLNKRLVNEALTGLGYKKITVDGWGYYRKAGLKDQPAGDEGSV